MSRRSSSRRGFTLVEAMVSLVILVIMMTVTLATLFSMRAFAQRQQSVAAPRQGARAAMDYLALFAEGAGDLNFVRNNPNAIVTSYLADPVNPASTKYASYNNVANANLADIGTDILTVAIPTAPLIAPIHNWPGYKHAANMDVEYRAGCPNETLNMSMFQAATFATNAGTNQAQSGILMLVDDTGAWCYFQITSYQSNTNCADPDGNIIHIVANPGQSGMIDPPGGHPGLSNPAIVGGVEFRTFRVRNATLEQKNGIFDPDTDNPGTAFFPIAENVEDFQVAYIYGRGANAGDVWNTGRVDPTSLTWTTNTLATPNGVPPQVGPSGVASGLDITNVVGLRVSITSRSLPLPLSSLKMSYLRRSSFDPSVAHHYRPDSEDHERDLLGGKPKFDVDTVGGPVYDHSRITTTLMLRNRMLGS